MYVQKFLLKKKKKCVVPKGTYFNLCTTVPYVSVRNCVGPRGDLPQQLLPPRTRKNKSHVFSVQKSKNKNHFFLILHTFLKNNHSFKSFSFLFKFCECSPWPSNCSMTLSTVATIWSKVLQPKSISKRLWVFFELSSVPKSWDLRRFLTTSSLTVVPRWIGHCSNDARTDDEC